MAVDAALIRCAAVPTVRFYGWDPPAISVGRFQPGRVDLEPLRTSGLPLVSRMTGGGAIVHWHELTYSVTVPDDHHLVRGTTAESYAAIHGPIRCALAELGVSAVARGEDSEGPDPVLCFHRVTSLDLVAEGRKLVGSAQRRAHGRVLQHGSIILRGNELQPDTADVESLLGRPVGATELADRLAPAFGAVMGPMEVSALTEAESSWAEKATDTYVFP